MSWRKQVTIRDLRPVEQAVAARVHVLEILKWGTWLALGRLRLVRQTKLLYWGAE